MKNGRKLILGSAVGTLVIASGVGWAVLRPGSATALNPARAEAPRFEVDPLWPRPLPNHMVMGSVTGVWVDERDHVFAVNHARSYHGNELNIENGSGECCIRTPKVVEFTPDGMFVRGWGAAGQGDWSEFTGGIAVDPRGNVWVGGGVDRTGGGGRGGRGGRGGAAAPNAAGAGPAGRGGAAAGPEDPAPSSGIISHVAKFTREGRYLSTIGRTNQPANSRSTNSFGGVARFAFDAAANEVYLADGYANRRVVVLDMNTGAVKRMWGAYGNQPDDAPLPAYNPDGPLPRQFSTVTCAVPSNDGFVYVCDRGNNRIQVFRKDGSYVRETQILPRTLGDGSVWDAALSRDAQQRFLYVADGMNERVHILDRQSLELLTSFGSGGRYPSHFTKLSSIAVDSQGNIYTGEDLNGHRVQKFLFKGIGEVTARDQGAVWPAR